MNSSGFDFFCAFNRSLEEYGLEPISREQYEKLDLFGGGYDKADKVLMSISPTLDARHFFNDVFDNVYPDCLKRAIDNGAVILFDDVLRIMQELQKKEKLIAISTNTGRVGAEMKLEILGISDFIRYMVTKNECEPKPNPEGLMKILNHFKVDAQKAIFIGDSEADEKAANRAEIAYVLINRRNMTVVDSLVDLPLSM